MYIDKLEDIVNKYKTTYHNKIKMKPIGVKSSTHIDSNKEINDKDPKFKVGDIVKISKYKNIFAKGYISKWPEEDFVNNDVVKKTEYNAKIKNIEHKIPDIINLVTNTAHSAVENKLPNVSNLVKKNYYNMKINEIEKKNSDHDYDKKYFYSTI